MHRSVRILLRFSCVMAVIASSAMEVTRAAGAPKPATTSKTASGGAQAADVAGATDAKAILAGLGSRYRALSSYEFEGMVRMQVTIQDSSQSYLVPFRLVASKPTKMRTEMQNGSITFLQVSDGRQTWTYVREAKQYTKAPTQPAPKDSAEAAALTARLAFGTPLQRYLTANERLVSARVVGDAIVPVGDRNVSCQRIEAVYEVPDSRMKLSPYTYWIDRASRVVVRDSVAVQVPAPDGSLSTMTTATTFRVARVDQPVHDSVFTFQPPVDAKLVGKIEMPGDSEPVSPLVGKPAEDFTLADMTGKPRRLSALKGKVVLIDFWATWCGPCRREMPNIVKLHKQLSAKGLAIVAVNCGEKSATVDAFLKKNAYALPVWLDVDSKVSRKYGANSIPTLVVVDRRGIVSSVMVGLHGEDDLRAALEKAGLEFD